MITHDLALGHLVVQRKAGFDDIAIEVDDFSYQFDIGATAGHIGGNRYRTGPTGFGDDLGFPVVVTGIE